MDPLTLMLIAKGGLDIGQFFRKRREAGKARDKTKQQNAMQSLISGLSPKVGEQQQPLPKQPGYGQLVDPLTSMLMARMKAPSVPQAALQGQPQLDKGALAANNITEILRRTR